MVISSSDGHNDSNAPRLHRNDIWEDIGDIFEALGNLIPGRKRNKPDKEDIAGSSIKEAIEVTKDKDIKDNNTGKGDPTEEKIVEKFNKEGLPPGAWILDYDSIDVSTKKGKQVGMKGDTILLDSVKGTYYGGLRVYSKILNRSREKE